jgi:hypothetical protein
MIRLFFQDSPGFWAAGLLYGRVIMYSRAFRIAARIYRDTV